MDNYYGKVLDVVDVSTLDKFGRFVRENGRSHEYIYMFGKAILFEKHEKQPVNSPVSKARR